MGIGPTERGKEGFMKTTAKDKPRKRCAYCLKDIPQPERGRKRKYCGRSCQGKAYRARQGKHDRAWHQKQREEQRILALPLTERVFDVESDKPLHVLSDGARVYRCLTCGEVYQTRRKSKDGQYYRYCSRSCEEKAHDHWRKAEDALIVLQQQNSRRSWPIAARMDRDGKLPGLCPVCGLPFPPNTGKVGRPRKYCSKQCAKVAYEQRWRTKNGTPRRHRFRECAYCGEKFDRTDAIGRRWKRFCSKQCRNRANDRTYRLREKGLKAPYRPKAKVENSGGRRKIEYNQVRKDGFDAKTGWPVAIAARIRALGLDETQGRSKAKTSQREEDSFG